MGFGFGDGFSLDMILGANSDFIFRFRVWVPNTIFTRYGVRGQIRILYSDFGFGYPNAPSDLNRTHAIPTPDAVAGGYATSLPHACVDCEELKIAARWMMPTPAAWLYDGRLYAYTEWEHASC